LIKESLAQVKTEPVEVEFVVINNTIYPAWNGKTVTLLIETAWE
jgi:hypothetical protein